MAYIAPTDKSTGTLITAAIWNADIVANEVSLNSRLNSYVVTTSSASNTINEVDIWTFTVPASTISDDDRIIVEGWLAVKNNKGTSGTLAPQFNVAGVSYNLTDTALTDGASEHWVPFSARLQRAGASLVMTTILGATLFYSRTMHGGDIMTSNWNGFGAAAGEWATAWTPNFATNIIISMSVTLSAASALFYVTPQACIAHKFGAS